MEIPDRQDDVLGERAVAALNTENLPALAVGPSAGEAGMARAAGDVDLAHDPLPHQLGARCRLDHLSHELVAEDARERVVAAGELEVGVADAGLEHADQGIAGSWLGIGYVTANPEGAVLEPEGEHVRCQVSGDRGQAPGVSPVDRSPSRVATGPDP